MLRRLSAVLFCLSIVTMAGCEPESVRRPAFENDKAFSTAAGFQVGGVHIIGLTRLIPDPENASDKHINTFVDVLDIFDSRIKAPCRFRFELYEFLPRSSRNLGKRVSIWPEFDLTSAKANNLAWKDHLRSYQFDLVLDFNTAQNTQYVLQVTCMTADGKRLTDTFKLQ